MRRSLRYLCISAFLVAGAWVFATPRLHGAEAPVPVADPAVSGALRVAHIALSVQNVERSSRWYRQMLGFRTKASHPQLRYEVRAMVLVRDGFEIELYERRGSQRSSPRAADHPNDLLEQGYRHVAFEVSDLEAVTQALRARGAFVTAGPARSEQDGSLSAYVADDSGNLIQLIQQPLEREP